MEVDVEVEVEVDEERMKMVSMTDGRGCHMYGEDCNDKNRCY